MSVFRTTDLQMLPSFPKRQDQLVIVKRKPLDGADIFFQKLMQTPFKAIGNVCKKQSTDSIQNLLEQNIPEDLQADPFYASWVTDMAQICDIFCETINSEAVGFCLSTDRGCRRYHIDNVPMRLLVTYSGQGTEWVSSENVDREALARGAPNEILIKDHSKTHFMDTWDIAIFCGGPKGLLHRTPDAALNRSSVLLRLDHESFWDTIFKQQQEIELL